MKKAWGPVRVVTAAARRQREGGEGVDSRSENEVLLDLYTALGNLAHPGGKRLEPDVVQQGLVDAALPTSLIEAYGSEDLDEEVRASHQDGIERVGTDVGTPIIAVAGTAFFGPVVTPCPKGEDAGRLWDGVLAVATTPGFYEIKRTRDERPMFD